MVAIELGRFDVVKALVSKGAKVNAQDDELFTPLIIACLANQPEIVDYLKSHSALAHADLD